MDSFVPTEDELIALLEAEERTMSVVITNPWHPDNPMIYVSEEFEGTDGLRTRRGSWQELPVPAGAGHGIRKPSRPFAPLLAARTHLYDRHPQLPKDR